MSNSQPTQNVARYEERVDLGFIVAQFNASYSIDQRLKEKIGVLNELASGELGEDLSDKTRQQLQLLLAAIGENGESLARTEFQYESLDGSLRELLSGDGMSAAGKLLTMINASRVSTEALAHVWEQFMAEKDVVAELSNHDLVGSTENDVGAYEMLAIELNSLFTSLQQASSTVESSVAHASIEDTKEGKQLQTLIEQIKTEAGLNDQHELILNINELQETTLNASNLNTQLQRVVTTFDETLEAGHQSLSHRQQEFRSVIEALGVRCGSVKDVLDSNQRLVSGRAESSEVAISEEVTTFTQLNTRRSQRNELIEKASEVVASRNEVDTHLQGIQETLSSALQSDVRDITSALGRVTDAREMREVSGVQSISELNLIRSDIERAKVAYETLISKRDEAAERNTVEISGSLDKMNERVRDLETLHNESQLDSEFDRLRSTALREYEEIKQQRVNLMGEVDERGNPTKFKLVDDAITYFEVELQRAELAIEELTVSSFSKFAEDGIHSLNDIQQRLNEPDQGEDSLLQSMREAEQIRSSLFDSYREASAAFQRAQEIQQRTNVGTDEEVDYDSNTQRQLLNSLREIEDSLFEANKIVNAIARTPNASDATLVEEAK